MFFHTHRGKALVAAAAVVVYVVLWVAYIYDRVSRSAVDGPAETPPLPKKAKRKVARRADSEFCRISKQYHAECEEPWHR
jgi:hypothetical protein